MSGCKVVGCPFSTVAKRRAANCLPDKEFEKLYPHIPVTVGVKFRSLPKDQAEAKRWLEACSLDKELNPKQQSSIVICTNHFHRDQYDQSTLRNLAALRERGAPRQEGTIQNLWKDRCVPNANLPSLAPNKELGPTQVDRRVRHQQREHQSGTRSKATPKSVRVAAPTLKSVSKQLRFDSDRNT